MRFEIGHTASFDASFYDSHNALVVLDMAPTVAFFKIDDTPALVGDPVVITATAPHTWEAVVSIPEHTDPGWYKIVWSGLLASVPITGEQNFEIVSHGHTEPMDNELNLRRRLNDKLADPTTDADAFFTNDEIHSLLAMAGQDVLTAALDGWACRMAYYQDAVDVVESGSDRKMSQLFRQAKQMTDFYMALIQRRQLLEQQYAPPVVGTPATLRGDRTDVFGMRYSPFFNGPQPYVRLFPLKRFIPYMDMMMIGQGFG